MEYEKIFEYLTEKALVYRYAVSPNPCVGACLLLNDTIIAEGYHKTFGGIHAEVDCLQNIQNPDIITNAILFITLEPCTHYGKTPPCAQYIVNKGIRHVVIGAKDPTDSATNSITYLQQNGVYVEFVNSIAARYCIQNFTAWHTFNIPHIMVKLASTIDGCIATSTYQSRWISNKSAQNFVQQLRFSVAQHNGAILVGASTVRYDDPELTVRSIQTDKQPRVLILANAIDEIVHCSLFEKRPHDCIVITMQQTTQTIVQSLQRRGVTFIAMSLAKDNSNFMDILQLLYTKYSIPYILCEGGGMLFHSLLQSGAPLEFYHIIAPLIFADNKAIHLAHGNTLTDIQKAHTLHLKKLENLNDNILATYSTI